MTPQTEFPTLRQSEVYRTPRRSYTLPTATFVSLDHKERLASCGCAKTPTGYHCSPYTKWSHK